MSSTQTSAGSIVKALSTSHDAPRDAVVEWMTKGPQTVTPDTDVKAALSVRAIDAAVGANHQTVQIIYQTRIA